MTLNVRESDNRGLEKSEIKKSEKVVQLAILSIQNFMNPFAISNKDQLYNIASGAPFSPDIERDILQADKIDKSSKEKFIQRYFISNSSRT